MPFTCSICSEELKPNAGRAGCSFCAHEEDADWVCPQGHYVCEDCRTAGPQEMVARVAAATRSQDPLAIATLIMRHFSFTPAGPEHHLIVAPAVLAALRNAGQDCVPANAVEEALARAADLPLGACASRGDCGGAVGAGIALSVVSGATPVRGRERSMALRATARAGLALADMGGVRCCKQAVFCGVEVAWESLRSSRVPALPAVAEHTCAFSGTQPDCKRKACPYHG